jgi:acyl-CoA synthetase (NDP forming)
LTRLRSELLHPRGIAVLGASADPERLGHRPLKYLAGTGFAGAVYPVNPRRERIGDLRSYPDLASVPDPVDLALISLAAEQVPDALDACAARGVGLAVILSAGLPPDLRLPEGLIVMGPNSMGFLDARAPVAATWNSTLDLGTVRAGSVGLIAQSGGLGGAVLNRLLDRGVGISQAFFSGEERFLDTCDFLELLLDDAATGAIVLLVEGLRRPTHFLDLARRARERGVPLIAFKLARSPRSAEAALAHTGMLAGRRRVQQAAFRQVGIVEAETLDEVVDLTVVFAARAPATPTPFGERLAVFTTSGGAAILAQDVCDSLGLELPPPSAATVEALRPLLYPWTPIANPLDVGAGLPEGDLLRALATLAADPQIDVLIPINTMIGGRAKLAERARGLLDLAAVLPRPLLTCWLGGSLSEDALTILRDAGRPHFLSVEACLGALRAAREYYRRRSLWTSP